VAVKVLGIPSFPTQRGIEIEANPIPSILAKLRNESNQLQRNEWWQIALVSFAVVLIGTLSRIKAGGDPENNSQNGITRIPPAFFQ
jgi:hypothetical protein